MRRFFLIPAVAAFFGGALLVGDAGAGCHKKKAACAPAPAPCIVAVPVVECAPAPVAVCAPAKKHCFGHMKLPKMGGFCHKKKAACAPAPVQCAAPAPYAAPCAPCGYPAPSYGAPMSAPQMMGMPSGQA